MRQGLHHVLGRGHSTAGSKLPFPAHPAVVSAGVLIMPRLARLLPVSPPDRCARLVQFTPSRTLIAALETRRPVL